MSRSPLRDVPVLGVVAVELAARLGIDEDVLVETADFRRPGHLSFDLPGPAPDRTAPLPYVRSAVAHGRRLDLRLDPRAIAGVVDDPRFATGLATWCRGLAAGRVVTVEHTSINPVHPVHLGALRGTFVGAAVAGLMRAAGADVRAHFFVNDMGRQAGELARAVEQTGWQHAGVTDEDFADHIGSIYAAAHLARRGRWDAWQRMHTRWPRLAGLPGWDRLAAAEERLPRMEPELLRRMLFSVQLGLGRFGIRIDSWDHESDYTDDEAEALRLIERTLPVQMVNGVLCCRIPGGLIAARRSDRTSLYFLRDVAYMTHRVRLGDLAVNVVGEDQNMTQRALEEASRGTSGGELRYVPIGWVHDPARRFSARRGHLISVNDLFRAYSVDQVTALRVNLLTSAAWRRRHLSDALFDTGALLHLRRRLTADRPASATAGPELATAMLGAYPALLRAVRGLQPHVVMNHALMVATRMGRSGHPSARVLLSDLVAMLGVDVTAPARVGELNLAGAP